MERPSAGREFHQPQCHRRVWLGKPRDRGEMIGAGDGAEAGVETSGAPEIDDTCALPEIFRALKFPDHGIETSTRRRPPAERTRSSCGGVVEMQRLVDRGADQRSQVEQT